MHHLIKSKITWAEISKSNIFHNINALKKKIGKKTNLMAVIKANAYGHGLISFANTIKDKIDYLAVARINEAVSLRLHKISTPLLILSYTPLSFVKHLIKYDITQTVFSYTNAKEISDIAKEENTKVKIHLKIDTGMGRLGILSDEISTKKNIIEEIEKIFQLENIELEGIYTHFANADSFDKKHAEEQFEIFSRILKKIDGIPIKIRHSANSAAIIDMPQTHLDMVRAGIALYGLYPSDQVKKNDVLLKPVLTLKSKVIQVKEVNKDFKVSYGSIYTTSKKSILATIPIGYGDGYNRHLSSFFVLINGKRAKIVGRICMDHIVADVSDINVKEEDEVVIIGKQKEEKITADEIASKLGTINYEVVSQLGKRIPKFYI